MVQLDHDAEMGPMHGMHGTLDAELEVRRTIKRAALTKSWVFLEGLSALPRRMLKARGPHLLYGVRTVPNSGLWTSSAKGQILFRTN